MTEIRRLITMALAICSLLAPGMSMATEENADTPKLGEYVYLRSQACPGEGCVFGRWRVRQDTPLFAALGDQRPRAILRQNRHVQAVDGLVYGIADTVLVLRDHEPYRRGDVLYVQDYIGEGFYHVWHDGRLREEDSVSCLLGKHIDDDFCKGVRRWARLQSRGASEWWVRVELEDGLAGWARGRDFAGTSSLDVDIDDAEVCWHVYPEDSKDNPCRARRLPSPWEDASVCRGMLLRGYLQDGDCADVKP